MSNPGRSEYHGPRRKLVLAFDVGTTFSGISYCILDPGQVPEILGVTRYPAQDHVSGTAKIPTIIYYDRQGHVRAAGAEAICEGIQEMAEEENWVKSEWFKLHLRPKIAFGKDVSEEIPPLPLNKTVVDVLADYLKYLFACAATFIQETHASGIDIWDSVKNEIDYVLSHPNGWEGAQQSEMRRAAILAGLILDSSIGHARLSFVTEGEASLHFAINNGLPAAAMKDGAGVVIVDAGGGTVDISSYSKKPGISKEKFDEIAVAQCHFHGSVFVTIRARMFLEEFLADSEYYHDINNIVQRFDKTTKLRFRSSQDPQYIKFGNTRDNDVKHEIRFGQLKLKGFDVALFFQPAIDCIIQAAVDQQKAAPKSISYIVLLGGFAANDWLFDNVNKALSALNMQVIRPTNHVHKAVSEGAMSFYVDHFVQTRVSKFIYGTEFCVVYDPADPEHIRRSADTLRVYMDGRKHIDGGFDTILMKNVPVLETKEFRRSYFRTSKSKKDFSFSDVILCYRGTLADPKWMDVDKDKYTGLCTVSADLSHLPLTPDPDGHFKLKYDIILLFGLTELRAQIAWKEKPSLLKDFRHFRPQGIEKRTPAKIVYDPDY